MVQEWVGERQGCVTAAESGLRRPAITRSQKRRQQRARASAWKNIPAQQLPINIHESVPVLIHNEEDSLIISPAPSHNSSTSAPSKLPFNAIPAGMETSTDSDEHYARREQQWQRTIAAEWQMEMEVLPDLADALYFHSIT